MKTALIHDWLTGMRGGEKVLEAFCDLFPNSDIFTLVYDPDNISSKIQSHRITSSFLQKLPLAKKRYRHFLPFMPWAIRQIDLSGYDLIISSSHCVAKGVKVAPKALHLCYCFTPMRYIWDQYDEYFSKGRASWLVRAAMALLRGPLQRWDKNSNQGVTEFVAISHHVASRIKNCYGREASVIFPPVETTRFQPQLTNQGYYLIVSALVPYKRLDIAVRAFHETNLSLKIIGSGPEETRLKKLAGKNVEFLGWISDQNLPEYYGGCKALIFPGEEDFGIVPVEAMASGKPVIAYGVGGARETIQGFGEPGVTAPTGLFFSEKSVASLKKAIDLFEKNLSSFDPLKIHKHALSFNRDRFLKEFGDFVSRKIVDWKKAGNI